MAIEPIGALVPTAIPGYIDPADIQASLRAYHYGSYSYDPANTSPAALVTPSIAKTIYDIEQASLNSVTLDGVQTLTNKTLTSPTISGLFISDASIVIEGASTNTYETTLTVSDPTQDNTITFPNTSGNLVIDNFSQTLTNKTLTAPIINLDINPQTGTTYIPVLSDNGKLVTLNNESAITVTVPTNISVSYATGAQINLLQLGTGQVNVLGDSGVILHATPGSNFRSQYSAATLIKLDTNTWLLTGDLSE